MKSFSVRISVLFGLSFLLLAAGCTKSPIAPARVTALNISIPMSNELRAEFLGNSINSVYYRIDGAAGVSLLEGTTGPFAAPASTGSIDLTVDVPPEAELLSLQLNSYAVGVGGAGPPPIVQNPLAIGAIALDSIGDGSTNATVNLGSVTRNCYFTNAGTTSYYYTYGFKNDNFVASSLSTGSNYDIQVEYFGTTSGAYYYYMNDASGNTTTPVNCIAYMGNGNLVDGDGVPDPSRFSSASTICKTAALGATTNSIETGDVYCIKLSTIPGGFAWMQFTNSPAFPTPPSFIFRVNNSLPYYAYDQTAADIGNNCSGTW